MGRPHRKLSSRTNVASRMVNPAQIFLENGRLMPCRGPGPRVRDMRVCFAGRALPSQMMELSHDEKDQRTTVGRLGGHAR